MMQESSVPGRYQLLQVSVLVAAAIFLAIVLSNEPKSTLLGFFIFLFVFISPGYLLLNFVNPRISRGRILLSPVVGIVTVTTIFDIFALSSRTVYFPYVDGLLALGGITLFAIRSMQTTSSPLWTRENYQTWLAGIAAVLSIAPVFWRSGRFSGHEFVFFGPAGEDHLYHLTLLQRLTHTVPPDNFIVSGLRAPVYHYFDDLTLSIILRTQQALHLAGANVSDVYYRCYPTFLYFLIAALAYRIGRLLLGSAKGGILSVLILLGGGGLACVFGVLQILIHAPHGSAMRVAFFSDWTGWDGVGSMLSLVHRPAQYHSLLIGLAATYVLLSPERSRRDWILAGLLLGLMAGFNFTLAATFGFAAVVGTLILFLRRRGNEARDLAWLAGTILIGSIPVNAAMLLSGFHQTAPGFPFRGPNLQYPTSVWGGLVGRTIPSALVPWLCLILLAVVAYGIKWFGLGPMVRLDLAAAHRYSLATILALVFLFSFIIGFFFTYRGLGINVVFLQPTLWILGLFSLVPIYRGLQISRWRWLAVWGLLGLTWVQSLVAFNLSCKVAFDEDTERVLAMIRNSSGPNDVVAYLPSNETTTAVWGRSVTFPNYAIMAMTGLDGYFSNELYTRFYAVPGLRASTDAEVFAEGERLYEQRKGDIEAFIEGRISEEAAARLADDHVRWIVVSTDGLGSGAPRMIPWQMTKQIVAWSLPAKGSEN